MPDLKSSQRQGTIVIYGPACFAGFELHETQAAQWIRHEPQTPLGTITKWQLSPTWENVATDPGGALVIDRYRKAPGAAATYAFERSKRNEPQPTMKFVSARATIFSDRDQIKKMNIGYSDEAKVSLNGQPLFEGRSAFHFRDQGFLGIMDVENDAVYLPLKKGSNLLVRQRYCSQRLQNREGKS
jgi:hypothetical protein